MQLAIVHRHYASPCVTIAAIEREPSGEIVSEFDSSIVYYHSESERRTALDLFRSRWAEFKDRLERIGYTFERCVEYGPEELSNPASEPVGVLA